ncbi:two-component response regulator-like APRR2 isoform X2 [Silene latifolia]|uniref:two-component response regulator-like APRR2 isoform X2 n=1 Tax=Silene latifolia TaxID=37657 RepID=UPI003D7832DE
MVCTANDLLEWKDFPKGLRVLLLDEDIDSSIEIKSKLEQMEYIVTPVFSDHEALCTIESKNERFHVAIIEISMQNIDERYKFLETAKDLPTIMMSKENCLSTMMKCIALGAVEFLIKPLSEEKLRNIWQHVVHKAFNTSESENSESLKSVKDFVGSVLKLQQFSNSTQDEVSNDPNNDTEMEENDCDQSAFTDKFPAPSTPQIKQGGRSLDDGDYNDQTNCSPVKESGDVDPETKFVDTTCCDNSFVSMEVDPPQLAIKEEDPGDGSKGSDDSSPKPNDNGDDTTLRDFIDNLNKETSSQKSSRPKSNRKKVKVDWTPELHKKFVQAVEQLGVDQAIPSRILELMKVDGLTRHNVASHLQKYRMNRRHILPKEDERRWPQPRDSMQRNYYTQRAVMAYPPYQTNHTYSQGQVYPVWGQQGGRPPGLPMWGPPTYPWQPVESWQWKPYPSMHADAWGCPVMPPPHPGASINYPPVQPAYRFQSPDIYGKHSPATHPGEEIIDKVVKEAISKPWLPLPIGLKPPSTDSVLAELSRQGISTVPPHHMINGHH